MPLNIVGTAGADSILGSIGDDSIDGGAGDDTLSGNIFGLDTLAGGAGADLFILNNSRLNDPTRLSTISDWESQDRISFADGGLTLTYKEATAVDYAAAGNLASLAFQRGEANFVVVQVGPDLFLFINTRNSIGSFEDEFLIKHATLADIDASNFLGVGPEQIPPTLGTAPVAGVGGAGVSMGGNMELIHPAELLNAVILDADEFGLELGNSAVHLTVQGEDFTYVNNQLVSGDVTGLTYGFGLDTTAPTTFSVLDVHVPAGLLTGWVVNDDAQGALSTLLAGSDGISGRRTDFSSRNVPGDLIHGYAGNDLITGQGGADTLYGGQGDDVIYATSVRDFSQQVPSSTYLRGEEGNDYIVGGIGFDDINGNQGNDTASGGDGDDWVVGGKDNDLLFGDAGNDIVYGNLGNDSCIGGAGNDLIRGGQGDDKLWGEAGNDWLSGDRGDDTLSGGLGADIFHTFSGAGVDRVVDFSILEGDRVQVDAGTTWTVSQVGADVVIDMGASDKMILVGVQLASLPAGWIFAA